jgi:hypothetical protein
MMHVPAGAPLVIALALVLSAPAALSQTVDASDPERLAKLLRDEGYRAKVGKDEVGDPKISSSSQGVDWAIYFYDCVDDQCKSIQYSIGFDTQNGVSLELMNSWNRANRYAKAHVDDEGDPFLKYDVDLDGGVTPANFVDTLKLWESLLGDFIHHINW